MANSRKHLIYLVYGRQTYHQEALFSIASAFAHLRDGAAHGLTVRVYTDDPSPYAGLPVQVREVTAEELVAWANRTAITSAPSTWPCATPWKTPTRHC